MLIRKELEKFIREEYSEDKKTLVFRATEEGWNKKPLLAEFMDGIELNMEALKSVDM